MSPGEHNSTKPPVADVVNKRKSLQRAQTIGSMPCSVRLSSVNKCLKKKLFPSPAKSSNCQYQEQNETKEHLSSSTHLPRPETGNEGSGSGKDSARVMLLTPRRSPRGRKQTPATQSDDKRELAASSAGHASQRGNPHSSSGHVSYCPSLNEHLVRSTPSDCWVRAAAVFISPEICCILDSCGVMCRRP